MHRAEQWTLGVISDTHGHLPAAVLEAFKGVERIVHAGDIGGPDILEHLGRLAPVTAVRGNMDGGGWAAALNTTEAVDLGSAILYAIHDLSGLDLDPPAAGFEAVIHGHTHRPSAEYRRGVLYLNPGSASLPRHRHPPTVALIRIRDKGLLPEFIQVGNR
jgi:putative phosphoesterase